MEVKKSPKADLEGKKSTWLLIGYVVVLAFMFVAFEWTQRDVKIDTSQAVADVVFEEEIIPITETPEQATPPPPEAPKVAELLEIVDDQADIEESTTILNEDNTPKVEVKYVPVQVVEEEPEEQTIFEVVENMPDFPGGQAALMQYLAKNIKYPTIAQENGTQGRVIVQFVVNKDGSIVDAKVVRSVDPYLDKEALRVINTMPKWKPGMQKGQAVAVKYTLPVMFRLEGGEMKSSRTVEMSRRPGSLLDSALVIVDGKEVTQSILNAINVDRIMSFSVLKDAASTAIYGERGKNGVILITLKEDKEEYHPSETYTLKNTNDPVVLGVKGTGKFTTVNGVQGIYINSKKANRGDVTFFVDGVKIDSSVADIGEVVPAERIESMSVEKGTDGKGQIYITTKDKRGVEKISAKGDIKVEGIVQDKDGEPVVGAAILIEGTKSGSITDVDGRFVLSASKGDKLVVSYIGMKTAKVKAEPKVTVTLKDE